MNEIAKAIAKAIRENLEVEITIRLSPKRKRTATKSRKPKPKPTNKDPTHNVQESRDLLVGLGFGS